MNDELFSYFDNAISAVRTTWSRLDPGAFKIQILERYCYAHLFVCNIGNESLSKGVMFTMG